LRGGLVPPTGLALAAEAQAGAGRMTCLPGGQPLWLAVPVYVAFALLCIVGPALAVLRLLRLHIDAAVVLPLGLALAAGLAWLDQALGWPGCFLAVCLALDLSLPFGRQPWKLAGGPNLRGAVWPALIYLALLVGTQWPVDRCAPDGAFLLDPLERVDTAFHVAVTWELSLPGAPQVPGLAGAPLHYHYAPHLVRAAAWRLVGLHPYDSFKRFDPLLWILALTLALRSAAGLIDAPRPVIWLAPFAPLIADLAFLDPERIRVDFWSELFAGNALLAVFFGNSATPALALALAVLVVWQRALAGEGRRWLLVGGALAVALPSFKVFVALQLLAGLAWAARVPGRRLTAAALSVPCALATAWLASSAEARALAIDWRPFAEVLAWCQATARGAPTGLGWFASVAAFVTGSLGLRLLGLAPAWRALRGAAPAEALSVMALVGWPLWLLVRISADGKFDETVYFASQSGPLLALFAFAALARFVAYPPGVAPRRARTVLAWAVAALLGLSTSLQFVWHRLQTAPERVPAEVARAMAVLARVTEPGETVLQTSFARWPPPPVVWIGRRVAFTEYLPYLEQFAPSALCAERLREVRRFFKTRSVAEAQAIARRTGARYVCVFGRGPREEVRELLDPVFESDDASVYRLRGEPAGP